MFRITTIAAALALALTAAPQAAQAQVQDIPEGMQVHRLPTQKLAGPRVGFTTFTGDVAAFRDQLGQGPVMSQFGWQFETQLVSTSTGHQALIEFIPLIGGIEQEDTTFSMNLLAGLRFPSGLEFGVGPSLSYTTQAGGDTSTSMVVAGGYSMPFGEIKLPMNVAVAFADGGPRFTTLVGWIVGG